MILSSRQLPITGSLRRVPPSLYPGRANPLHPQDAAKNSFQHLLESPLPSPGLPSIVPRYGRKISSYQFRGLCRLLFWTCGVGVILWFVLSTLAFERPPSAVSYLSHDGDAYEIIGDDTLPELPSPVIVTDRRGKLKWTVSIPPDRDFPLRPQEYSAICAHSTDVSRHVAQLKSHDGDHHQGGRSSYYHVDPNYMDVAEAEHHGMLPGVSNKSARWIWRAMAGKEEGKDSMSEDMETMPGMEKRPVCGKSLTYVMGSSDAGFGETLMGLWMAYGLAKKEGRAFFIDDSSWAYGRYTTFFRPIAAPPCLRPPKTQILPCPHSAHHLLVSAATTFWTFGHAFNEHFEDAHKIRVMRQQPIFSLLRKGYEALFHLATDDAKYINQRIEELNKTIQANGGITVGVHVRHGDRHPFEFQYQGSYIPLEQYAETARGLISGTSKKTTIADTPISDDALETSSRLILASDDPDVYTSAELSHALRAQTQLMLASKTALDAATGDQIGNKYVDDNIGWEGGFFKDVFWSLGRSEPSARSRNEESERPEPTGLALQLRELVGRAYLLDLAVLGQSDRVVCGASSVACRLLAVMMGWERGIVEGGWRNVDGQWDWRGIIW